ncbi:MAG TPA: Xaa-Pro peptidase family protein [Syntrophorhabdaceae bacterium]|nr:Xaa-Pro peptidase family protein [Syntrophorhabdaceae bacterium]
MLKQVGYFDPVPKEDLIGRIDRLRQLMADSGFDLALLLQNVDRFYFTGTMQKGVVAVPLDQDPLVFVEKGTDRAAMETPLNLTPVKNDREIGDILRGRRLLAGKVGLELDVLPVAVFERMKRVFDFERCGDVSEQVREVRAVKSRFELDQIVMSGRMLTSVFSLARDEVREGRTELGIEAALTAAGREMGHQGFLRMRGMNQEMMTMTVQAGFTGAIPTLLDAPITGTGVTPAVPQGSSFKKVERGVPVTIDYGGGYNGYITDETRSFVVGDLAEPFRKPYETARSIIEDVLSFAGPGTDCRDIFHRAEGMARKAGLSDLFMGHGEGKVAFIGHGLGLEINELPVLTPRHERILKEGMVFAFEPKFVLPDLGAVGMEIDLIVGSERLERVTTGPFDLVCL